MGEDENVNDIQAEYQALLKEHGPSVQAVGWSTEEAQHVRFAAALDHIVPGVVYSIRSVLDVGCGFGDLVDWIDTQLDMWRDDFTYTGIDMVPEFIDIAKARHDGPKVRFYEMDILKSVPKHSDKYDMTIASGTFSHMSRYDVVRVVQTMWELTSKVMVFNLRHETMDPSTVMNLIAHAVGISKYTITHDYLSDDTTVHVYRNDRVFRYMGSQ